MKPVPKNCDHARKVHGEHPDRFCILFFNVAEKHLKHQDEGFTSEIKRDERMAEVVRLIAELKAERQHQARLLYDDAFGEEDACHEAAR